METPWLEFRSRSKLPSVAQAARSTTRNAILARPPELPVVDTGPDGVAESAPYTTNASTSPVSTPYQVTASVTGAPTPAPFYIENTAASSSGSPTAAAYGSGESDWRVRHGEECCAGTGFDRCERRTV